MMELALVAAPYLQTAATVLSGVSAVKTAFGGNKGPSVKKPAMMPAADDEAVRAADRRRRATMAAQSGRASTVLSQDESLGG
jgi:hypothetical protein